jgi:hypothetical protein
MKKVLIIIMGFLLWIAILYLAFAFVKTEPNAFKWREDARFGLVVLSLFYLAFTPPIYYSLSNEKI